MVPVKVSGPVSFLLLAVWTLPVESNGSYVQPLFEALALYKNLFVDTPVVWAGDFNSNFLFDRPNRKYKFRDFVSELEKLDIKSLYHCQSGCRFGEETEKTFFMYHRTEKPYHIDYIFSCSRLRGMGFDLKIQSPEDWLDMSDHVPVSAEFDPMA